MTDIATTEDTPEVETTEAPKGPKPKPEPHPCICGSWAVGDGNQTTGCGLTTQSDFAQGHDAKLASFLAKAEIDGLPIRRGEVQFPTASAAVADVSAKLQAKVERQVAKGTEKLDARKEREAKRNADREARNQAKAAKAAEREAEKAKRAEEKAAKTADAETQPREVAVTVAEGSETGDIGPNPFYPEESEPHPAQHRIKVGRWEYEATLDESGNATFLDSEGAEQTREAGTFRILGPVE